ncbi:MAG: endolytic transglycosylase MltG [Spirochaetales bacterium]|nr:endolytic transglycosylase MltG [Spirochaetales bacterium]
MGKVIKFLIFISLFIIIFSVALLAGASYLNGPVGLQGEENIIFSIEEGDSLNTIANSLVDSNLIKYSWSMKLYSRLMRTESLFKIGVYGINSNMTLMEIHDYLVEGKQQLYKVTIPEGWTSHQIANYLEEEEITDSENFIKAINSIDLIEKFNLEGYTLEGLLYPDTYLFQKKYPAEKIVSVMVNNFFKRLEKIQPDYRKFEVRELMDTIILASIVEREYRDPSEAPLMAGVFYNRLTHKNPIPLGSCATIVYIITDIQEKEHPKYILYSDLEIESPYNTYINSGLPPGPISNPGEIALKAAFFPEKSEYLYFLLKSAESGQHEFTRNLSEHTEAYNLYIKKN